MLLLAISLALAIIPMSADYDAQKPIGVFDSGLGGLSVLREIYRQFPDERLIYVADSAHAPYGTKTADFITWRCEQIVAFLEEQQCKAVVVACNSATAICIEHLRANSNLPIIGIEPAIKPAAASSHSRRIGLLATQATLNSKRLMTLQQSWAQQCEVICIPCPGFVECVERGDISGPHVRALASPILEHLTQMGVDRLILGCTHYPFLLPLFNELVKNEMHIIDPAPAVAKQLGLRLSQQGLLARGNNTEVIGFYSSAPELINQQIIQQLWGTSLCVQSLPA